MQWWSPRCWLTGTCLHHKPCLSEESNSYCHSKDRGVLCLGDEVELMLPNGAVCRKRWEKSSHRRPCPPWKKASGSGQWGAVGSLALPNPQPLMKRVAQALDYGSLSGLTSLLQALPPSQGRRQENRVLITCCHLQPSFPAHLLGPAVCMLARPLFNTVRCEESLPLFARPSSELRSASVREEEKASPRVGWRCWAAASADGTLSTPAAWPPYCKHSPLRSCRSSPPLQNSYVGIDS